MFAEYIQAALEKAEYEVIDNPEPFYAHVPGLVVSGLRARPLRTVARS